MLLTRLVEHAPHLDLPPVYYRNDNVRWALSLDAQGRVKSVDSAGTPGLASLADSDRPKGTMMATPYVNRTGQKPPPMLLVDTLQYVLAKPADDSDEARAEAERRHQAYVSLIEQWADHAPQEDATVARAVVAFFQREGHRSITQPANANHKDTVALRVEGRWVHETHSAEQWWRVVVAQRKSGEAGQGVCLSCGQAGQLLNTLPGIIKAGVIPDPSGRVMNTVLVSVNKKAQGRGGRTQLADIPVCDKCGSTAMAVLNSLLATREHRYRTSDSVTVWWLKRPAPTSLFRSLREASPEDIRALYDELDRPHTGLAETPTDPNDFYALTLSANQSRIVVRDWLDVPLTDVLEHARTWFEDHQVQDLWNGDLRHVALWRLARCLGRWEHEDNKGYVPGSEPKVAEHTLLTMALRGAEYRPPVSLLQRLDQRIGADGRVDLPRAALLKLLLLRRNPDLRETVMPSLNHEDTHPAVLCGRLFATFEQIQYKALRNADTRRGPNTTVGDKYFSAAKARPLPILEMIHDTAKGHLKKLRRDNFGAWSALDHRLEELYTRLGAAPPATLDLESRALFIVGYYQQRADDRAAAAQTRANGNGGGDDPPRDDDDL